MIREPGRSTSGVAAAPRDLLDELRRHLETNAAGFKGLVEAGCEPLRVATGCFLAVQYRLDLEDQDDGGRSRRGGLSRGEVKGLYGRARRLSRDLWRYYKSDQGQLPGLESLERLVLAIDAELPRLKDYSERIEIADRQSGEAQLRGEEKALVEHVSFRTGQPRYDLVASVLKETFRFLSGREPKESIYDFETFSKRMRRADHKLP